MVVAKIKVPKRILTEADVKKCSEIIEEANKATQVEELEALIKKYVQLTDEEYVTLYMPTVNNYGHGASIRLTTYKAKVNKNFTDANRNFYTIERNGRYGIETFARNLEEVKIKAALAVEQYLKQIQDQITSYEQAAKRHKDQLKAAEKSLAKSMAKLDNMSEIAVPKSGKAQGHIDIF